MVVVVFSETRRWLIAPRHQLAEPVPDWRGSSVMKKLHHSPGLLNPSHEPTAFSGRNMNCTASSHRLAGIMNFRHNKTTARLPVRRGRPGISARARPADDRSSGTAKLSITVIQDPWGRTGVSANAHLKGGTAARVLHQSSATTCGPVVSPRPAPAALFGAGTFPDRRAEKNKKPERTQSPLRPGGLVR